jgi:hypothetical protein
MEEKLILFEFEDKCASSDSYYKVFIVASNVSEALIYLLHDERVKCFRHRNYKEQIEELKKLETLDSGPMHGIGYNLEGRTYKLKTTPLNKGIIYNEVL